MRVGIIGTPARAVTGADGRFTIPGCGKDKEYRLFANAPEGQPYFVTCVIVPDAVGLAPIEVDIACVRGVPFRLRLTDAMTGKPVIADVTYWLLHPNPIARAVPGYSPTQGFGARSDTPCQGRRLFTSACVLPGPGAIRHPRANDEIYMPACVDTRAFFASKRPGRSLRRGGAGQFGDGGSDWPGRCRRRLASRKNGRRASSVPLS